MSRDDILLGKIAQKTAQPRATGEKPISEFPTLDATGVTDNTELTIVESAVNYKINKSEFNKTIKSGSVLFLDWDMVTTPDLTLTADQLNSATKIFIDLTDTSFVAVGSLTLDGSWSADYVEIRIRDRTIRGEFPNTSTSISILLGTQSLQTFYFYNYNFDSMIYNIDFDIIKGEFRNPFGVAAYVDEADSNLPIIGKTPTIIPDNVVYKYNVLSTGLNYGYTTDSNIGGTINLFVESKLLGYWERENGSASFPSSYMGVSKDKLITNRNYHKDPDGFRSYSNRAQDTEGNFADQSFVYSTDNNYFPSLIILEGEYK